MFSATMTIEYRCGTRGLKIWDKSYNSKSYKKTYLKSGFSQGHFCHAYRAKPF